MLALGGAALSSPKQTATERQSSVFPYYAGFSRAFVRDVLTALEVTNGQVVLDPWNGSGTTTSVASEAGLSAIGIDLNPAMAVVAKARLAIPSDVDAAQKLAKRCGSRLSQAFLREMCRSPYASATQSMFLLAVFRLTRRKLREKDLIATNPTWWHLNRSDVSTAIASISRTQLDAELAELKAKVSIAKGRSNEVSLIRDDLLSVGMPNVKADIILTSPPYLTRIDYVKATLPELIVLSLIESGLSIDGLRRAMIGTPVVGQGPDSMPSDVGEYTKSILMKIASHESKASKTYYSAFFSAYVSKMREALEKISAMSQPGAKMVLVVQGSHYKEIFVDLARVVTDFASFAGFELLSRADFNFKQSFAQLNPRANGYNSETAQETALLFKRAV